MSTRPAKPVPGLSRQEALTRVLIAERVAAHHHAPGRGGRSRRQVRAALILRRIADRLDPSTEAVQQVPHQRRILRPYAGSPRA